MDWKTYLTVIFLVGFLIIALERFLDLCKRVTNLEKSNQDLEKVTAHLLNNERLSE